MATGVYSASARMSVLRIRVVNGATITGLYATDGALNVVQDTGAVNVGSTHPCGALRVRNATADTAAKRYHANGSINVQAAPFVASGAQRVEVISGALV